MTLNYAETFPISVQSIEQTSNLALHLFRDGWNLIQQLTVTVFMNHPTRCGTPAKQSRNVFLRPMRYE